MISSHKIAVLIPCYNEETTVIKVVRDFQSALPQAAIYVYDNNSTDHTFACAQNAGAITRREPRKGKGNVVRRMFADIEADIYVLVDGDDTYDANSSGAMVSRLILESVDQVTGRRVHTDPSSYRSGHIFGNWLLTSLTGLLFNVRLLDMLSGYRVFSRRFVKSFPFTATGFGIETELTVHGVRLLLPTLEVDTPYSDRPAGSVSKLSTWQDGFRILLTISHLIREERPLMFFTCAALALLALAAALGVPIIVEFVHTGLVPRVPSAILTMGLIVLAFLSLTCGLILDTVTRGRWEAKRMAYLALAAPSP